jgi:hypothetical protein
LDGKKLPRLEFRTTTGSNLDHTSQLVYQTPVSAITGAPKQNTKPLPKLDFKKGAKEFRKKQLAGNIIKGVTEALVIVAIFVSLLTMAGVLINKKFEGRSLPFTYVGNLSIGGKTQAQIKALLDEHYGNMYITFSEGGLRRQLKLDQLNIAMDTEAASKKAIPQKLNPLSFLNWQRLEVPVKMSDRYVAGFLERRINSGQTESEDAQLVIDRNKLAVRPEIVGFKSDNKFIINQIKLALASARTPNIDVTSVTTKPSVAVADLNDDLDRVNKLLQTPVNIKFGYSYIRPTLKQKMAWLNINQPSGAKNVDFDFSKGLIRAYILEQVNKYKPQPKNLPDGTVEPTSRIVVENIDEVADSVSAALKNGHQLTQQLVTRNSNDHFTVVTSQAATTSAVATR